LYPEFSYYFVINVITFGINFFCLSARDHTLTHPREEDEGKVLNLFCLFVVSEMIQVMFLCAVVEVIQEVDLEVALLNITGEGRPGKDSDSLKAAFVNLLFLRVHFID